MRAQDLTVTSGADQFYPTPPSVAGKMLAGLDFNFVQTVLEPSAGKGDLVDALLRAYHDRVGRYRNGLDIDVCEIDPHLRQICKYQFSKEKENEIYDLYKPLDCMYYASRTPEQAAEHKRLKREMDILACGAVHIVHDDFFTYHTHKHYNLILMNPPFAEGDLHLLRAINIQKNGGSIICLLNAETIRNPYTATRMLLAQKLKEYDAKIQYIEDAFSADAERKAKVDVAIVRIHIPEAKFESTIYERMKKAYDREVEPDPDIKALVAGDYIEQAVQMYNVEVDATMELIKEYMALKPYMAQTLGGNDKYDKAPILNLVVEHGSTYGSFDYHAYMRLVRLKYWRALFHNDKFTGRLTSELQEKYHAEVEKMANYEFSVFNIKQVLIEMNASMTSGIEKAIMDLFDKLTEEHSWYPECQQNRHYFNGWATNKAHKIGKKCIIPTYGLFSSYSWVKETFKVWDAYKVISDIEKAFNYLDGGRTLDVNLQYILEAAANGGVTRNIMCKYFKIDLFKKGTMHIKFYPESMDLVERLNIYASQKKGWLPPNYGKTSYKDMQEAEQAVVDSFHGDGSEGSGAEAYAEVIRNSAFYLAEPTQKMPALMAPAT